MIRPFQNIFDFQNTTFCAHNFWKESIASTNSPLPQLHPSIHLFIKQTMLIQLTGSDNKARVDLLLGCHALWVEQKEKRATYAMAENTTSIVNVKLHGKHLTNFITIIIFVIYKLYLLNNFCNSQLLSHMLF
jgi:hypothetical protein